MSVKRQVFAYCKHTGKVLPIEEKWANERKFEPNKAHYVQQDSMPATEHPATGEVFESKSAFRRVTKAMGCVEVGNEYKQHIERGTTKSSHQIERERREYREGIREDVTKTLAKFGIH